MLGGAHFQREHKNLCEKFKILDLIRKIMVSLSRDTLTDPKKDNIFGVF